MSGPTSVEQIVNAALDRAGFAEYIGNIYEGTKQARVALNLFGETRDALLRQKDWPFALAQTAGIVAVPTMAGWAFSWTYPAGCLRVRSVEPSPLPAPDYDPRPVLFTIYNPLGTAKLILTQITPISINFTARVIDLTTWDPLFVDAMIDALAQRFTASLRGMAPSLDPDAAVDRATAADEALAPNDAAPLARSGRPA